MFSLIISIIAIALVVALAGATLYYGGDAFSKGSAAAQASTLANQGQQIAAAHTLYAVDHGGATMTEASTIGDLVTEGYLSAMPTPPTGSWAIEDTFDMDGTGTADTAKVLVIADVQANLSDEVCAEAQKQGGAGAGATDHSSSVYSCVVDVDGAGATLADNNAFFYKL
ncbi:hypothetical protein [Neptuniibacter sp. QD37_11]|uniref:hypothetical protein n=1 Tax=Neptuniibacter sp. QD37_11 TaxID=3398209 RepID=UPI0039F58442